jgi:hypothetical protein
MMITYGVNSRTGIQFARKALQYIGTAFGNQFVVQFWISVELIKQGVE